MDKLMFLVTYSLRKKFVTKAFIISNIVIFLLTVGIMNLDIIIKSFGGDFSSDTVIYVDNEANLDNSFITNLEKTLTTYHDSQGSYGKLELKEWKEEDVSKFFENEDNKKAIVLKFTLDSNQLLKTEVISKEYISTEIYSLIQIVSMQMRQSHAYEVFHINTEQLALINSGNTVERTILDSNKTEYDELMKTIMGPLIIFAIMPIFFAIIIVVSMIGMEINEEKSSRSMEIIISNVKPVYHFTSKIIAVNVFMIVQSILFGVFGYIGYLIRGLFGNRISVDSITNTVSSNDMFGEVMVALKESHFIDRIPLLILFILIFLILGYTLYAVLTGILSSVTNSLEDYQRIIAPIMILLLISFYSAIFIPMFEGAVFIKILAYIPFFSPILAIVSYASNQLSEWDLVIIILINISFIYVLYYFGMKIYKIAILDYSQKDIWKRLWKNIKASKHV